jgi:hypothetical protein
MALNDDDAEVRAKAANVVSSVLTESLTPPAASEKFMGWLLDRFRWSPRFARHILYRMTREPPQVVMPSYQGPFVPAQSQFDLALKEDNSLFAEEEPNLYHDEVRDMALWSELFREIDPRALVQFRQSYDDRENQDNFMIVEFAAWVADAVDALNKIMTEDGPLGWTSKPAGFTVVFRVLRCANVLVDYHAKHIEEYKKDPDITLRVDGHVGKVTSALETFRGEAEEKNIHPRLIQELSGDPAFNISLKWKRGSEFDRSDLLNITEGLPSARSL